MSKTTAIQFIHKVGGDSALQDKIRGLNGNMAGLLAVAAETGYPFSRDEWNSAVIELAESIANQLSDKELDNVAGGFGYSKFDAPEISSFSWGASFLPPNVNLNFTKP